MKYIRLITISLGIIILSTLGLASVAGAQSFKTGDTVTVAARETIDSMLFAGGNNINIAGIVNGDVYCAGQDISISGTVNGDVFCGGGTITVSGTIEGDARLAGQNVTITGTITGSATIGAQDFTLDNNGVIGRDLLGGTQNTTINGTVQRDIVAGADNMTIGGKVGRNIKSDINSLIIGSTGRITGDVEYTSSQDITINNGGQILGATTKFARADNTNNTSPLLAAFGGFVFNLLTMTVIGVVITLLFPRILSDAADKTTKNPGKAILIGLASLALTPVLIIGLLITIVGAPLAIMIGLTWVVIMILSVPFAGYLIGKKILKKFKHPVYATLIGILIIAIGYAIPFIGFIVGIAVYTLGSGMLLVQSQQLVGRVKAKR